MKPTFVHRDPDARVLVFSLRTLLPSPSRCCNYEFEDLLPELDRVDVIAPPRPCGPPKGLQRAIFGRLGRSLPLLRTLQSFVSAPLDRDYDLFFIHCQNPGDLLHLGPLAPWRARCRRTAVYVDELWAHTVAVRPGEMAMLAQFDHIFVGQEHSVGAIAAATGQPVTFLPIGVDMDRFCPFPDPPARTIDVFNMGRRSPATHVALKRLAAERGLFYMFDTTNGKATVYDPADHRTQLANLIKRARYFITNVAKITSPEETAGQQEVGFRFYEGAAAGAVMIGEPPRCPSFDANFGWEDAVVYMPFGTATPSSVIDVLDAAPERVDAIRRRNVANSLRLHDWVYRWAPILDVAGLQPTERLPQRRTRLTRLANEVDGNPSKVEPVPRPTILRAA